MRENQVQALPVDHKHMFVRVLLELAEGELALLPVEHLLDEEERLVAALEARAHGDARGRLHLVPRQHPYLDAGTPQTFDRYCHLVLQFV